ncbi:glycosyltransferase family 1 protein [Favolaschia claudopus]|uniref:Glycosyltransferase family 1 protein n=1 Tax=Favolaschia claudopus TaxID=2862362 RepID=A0AAV9ZMZ8_9AGAR
MSAESIRHILLFPLPAYGHTRPMCALAGRFAGQGTNIVVTLLTGSTWLQNVEADVGAQFPTGHEALKRIRIVSLFDATDPRVFTAIPTAIQHFPAAYETLFHGKSITCTSTQKTFPAVPRLSALILDVFAIASLQAARALSGTTVPILAFVSAPAAALIRMFCAENLGGRGDFGKIIDAEVERSGRPVEEVSDEVYQFTNGTIVRIPGLPPMYDYEHTPQTLMKSPIGIMNRFAYDLVMGTDGVFASTTPAYDGESFFAFESFMRDTLKKSFYGVGPLLPPGYGNDTSVSSDARQVNSEIILFLENVKAKFGERSMLYISFGTIFWPEKSHQIEDLVDTLIQQQFPFFFCHATPQAVLSQELLQKIESCGIGMASAWAPQHFILTNPVTGWFLTHCGFGGINEALAAGVPLICWPFAGDQSISAVHLTTNLNIAFNLMEVRTSNGLRPLFDGTTPSGTREAMRAELARVFEDCRGEVGEEKRKNAREMKGELMGVWGEGGSSEEAIQAFLRDYASRAQ